MMGTDFRGASYSAVLAPANQFEGPNRARMREVNMPASQAREQDVADDHDLFRFRRNTLEAKLCAHNPFVHRAAGRKRGLLAVIDHRNLESPRVLQRGPHQLRASDRLAVVADSHGTRTNHLSEFRQRLAFLAA